MQQNFSEFFGTKRGNVLSFMHAYFIKFQSCILLKFGGVLLHDSKLHESILLYSHYEARSLLKDVK